MKPELESGMIDRETDVLVVTSAFPLPSEAFAAVEFKALERAGARLRIRAFRPARRESVALAEKLRLRRADVTHARSSSYLHGVLFALRHPVMACRTLLWVVWNGRGTPGLTSRCVLLLPRFFEIFAECLRSPPSVIYLYWGHYPAVVGYLARRYLRHVHVSMGLYAFDLVYRFGPGIRLADEVDTLVTLAECNVEQIRSLGVASDRLQVFFHGIDLAEVPAPAQLARKRPGSIVTIARLVKNKGVDDALRVFALAKRRSPGLTLKVIGEGEELESLRALADQLGVGDSVEFAGAMPHDRVYEELAIAEFFLLMSRNPSERLPNAVKEAMACRCICVVTESPGIEELLQPLARKLVVRMGDCEGAANKLVEATADCEANDRDRQAGREFILANFDASRIARDKLTAWLARRAVPAAGGAQARGI